MNHYRIRLAEFAKTPMAVLEIYLEEDDLWSVILGQTVKSVNGWIESIPVRFMERVAAYFENHVTESYTIWFDF